MGPIGAVYTGGETEIRLEFLIGLGTAYYFPLLFSPHSNPT